MDLGFQFKYSLEDMFTGAVETCREKGLIPASTKITTTVSIEKVAVNGSNPASIETAVNDTS